MDFLPLAEIEVPFLPALHGLPHLLSWLNIKLQGPLMTGRVAGVTGDKPPNVFHVGTTQQLTLTSSLPLCLLSAWQDSGDLWVTPKKNGGPCKV